MTTDEIILAVCGIAVAIIGPVWARWHSRRFERETGRDHPAE